MGYNNEFARSPLVFDIETCGLENAAEFLDPVTAAKNLKDPDKIKADIEARTAERDGRLALDWNVGRIAALGWWTSERGVVASVCKDERAEASLLSDFWHESKSRTLLGFNIKGFDLKFMVQRSRYLGIDYPILDFSKYSRGTGIRDLFLELTFNDGTYDQGAMRRSLQNFCRRFGIPVDDEIKGAEVPALVAAGEWDAVLQHVKSDVELCLALSRKLGIIRVEEAVA